MYPYKNPTFLKFVLNGRLVLFCTLSFKMSFSTCGFSFVGGGKGKGEGKRNQALF